MQTGTTCSELLNRWQTISEAEERERAWSLINTRGHTQSRCPWCPSYSDFRVPFISPSQHATGGSCCWILFHEHIVKWLVTWGRNSFHRLAITNVFICAAIHWQQNWYQHWTQQVLSQILRDNIQLIGQPFINIRDCVCVDKQSIFRSSSI